MPSVTAIDTSAAEKMPGVKAVHVVAEAGTEIQWDGQEVAAVAATTEEVAREAVRKIKVEYEVLPHFVNEDDLGKAGARGKAAGEQVTGDPDKAFQEAEAVSEGTYGIPVITHCCLEPHGQVIQWQGDQVHGMAVHPERHRYGPARWRRTSRSRPPISRSRWTTSAAASAASSAPDAWAEVGARLSQKAGGKPVKLFLDRATRAEDRRATVPRPSARSRSAARRTAPSPPGNPTPGPPAVSPAAASRPCRTSSPTFPTRGSITCRSRSTPGPRRPGARRTISRRRFLTCSAIEDFAAKVGVDPLEVFDKNAGYTPRARAVSLPAAEGRRAGRVEEAVEAARPQTGSGPSSAAWASASTPGAAAGHACTVPHHHQSRWLRGGRNGHAGSRHRHAHDHRRRWRPKPSACRWARSSW